MIKKIDHLYVETKNFEKAKYFWMDLGFQVASEWGEDEHKACQLNKDGASIVLANTKEGESPVKPTVHFNVSDIEGFSKVVEDSSNIKIETPLEDTHWGTKWIRVIDPDGNTYALEQV